MTTDVPDITRSAARLDESLSRHFGLAVLSALAEPKTTDLLLSPERIL